MAGGGAAASALSSPWRALLQRALDANAHLKHSTFFQLATVGGGGRPANRTVVFRGFQEHCDKIQINTDARSNKQREKAWFASSVKSRLQYLGPSPGIPVANDDHVTDVHLDPSAGPVDTYCLLTLDPENVDYVNLKSNQRLMFTRTQEGDESSDWMARKVSP
ncbi:unnamed protein product [Triticum turgidum subsp. durum]|uniref:pyridoxal 5'-phosphate synthase n=1 Tax=Triticum turgidum subsp. durum TaxID=4567 RepID=A0A9R0WHZ4_TRITD|nr:unnamed protein product [Triticum turgidum subsp. durum]